MLAEIEQVGPDLIVVGGDVAAGPMPAATIDRLMALGTRARFIRGNADREVVDAFDDRPGSFGHADEAQPARIARWSAGRITRKQREFLASFEGSVVVEVDRLGATLFCHGSPRSDAELITAATPEARVAVMVAGVPQRVVVCGHTHMQFDRGVAGARVINAGSVGMPYEGRPGAYWVLIGPDVDFRRTVYDVQRAADLVRASGYPDAEDFARGNILEPPSPEEAIAVFEGRPSA